MKIENAFAPNANAVAIRVRGSESARRVCSKNTNDRECAGGLLACVQVTGGYWDTIWTANKVPSSISIGASAGWFSTRTVRFEK